VSRLRHGAPGAALAVVLLAVTGCGMLFTGAREPDPARDCTSATGTTSQQASKLLIEGARVFDERCSPCHGDTGHGDGILADLLPMRPRNYHTDAFQWGTSWSEIAETVRLGRSGVMPPFEGALSQEEIRAVSFLVTCWVQRREP
jgi:mono/diheme cytochrome c family protein